MRENATIFFRLPHRLSPLTPALSCIIMKERSGDKVLLKPRNVNGTVCAAGYEIEQEPACIGNKNYEVFLVVWNSGK